jgi:hypothetical protein
MTININIIAENITIFLIGQSFDNCIIIISTNPHIAMIRKRDT